MKEVTLTIKDILNTANKLCDDNVNHNILIQYFNKGVNNINSYANLKLPMISYDMITSESNAANIYDVATQPFVNNQIAFILTNFVAKTIKDVEGYSIESNEFNSEYANLLVSFSSKYKTTIRPEFQLQEGDGGPIVTQKKAPVEYWLKRNRLY